MAIGSVSRPEVGDEEKDQINLFIFDWSGVISDDRQPVFQAYLLVRKDYNLPPISFDEWLHKVNLTIAVELEVNHGIKGDREGTLRLYAKHYADIVSSGIKPKVYPDVMETFNYLKDRRKKLAVVSAHPEGSLLKEAKEYGLAHFFDKITGSCTNKGAELPKVCERLGERKESSLYIDDTIYGIKSAKFAGVRSAGVSTGYHTRKMLEAEAPDFLLYSLSELMALV